ncbi:leucine-rich_repeat domain-containing protein [Hexamita inflata]|uniref:Leucine-rich repeat domain-containing protein n=1 Tax=Hexamita inflata TaxID=28002 RepID=A0AA86NGH3_9EUKA|nr:leucine-rich repeat domain-containing protein [Hexamita inflata]
MTNLNNSIIKKLKTPVLDNFDGEPIYLGLYNNILTIDSERMPYCKKLTNLENIQSIGSILQLNLHYLDDISLTGIDSLKGLQCLYVLFCENITILQLKFMSTLTELSIIGCYLDDLSSISDLVGIKVLKLNKNRLTSLRPLQNLVNMHVLYVFENMIASLDGIQYMTELVSLQVSNNRLASIMQVQNMKKLQILKANLNQIKDISPLRDLTRLQHLSLKGNRISSIQSLKYLTELQFLCLDNNRILQSDELFVFSFFPLLQDLSIYNNPVHKQRGFKVKCLYSVNNSVLFPLCELYSSELIDYYKEQQIQVKKTNPFLIEERKELYCELEQTKVILQKQINCYENRKETVLNQNQTMKNKLNNILERSIIIGVE